MKRVRKIVHYQNKWLGNGIVIVVMDTGVSSHPDLKGRILLFRDFVNGRYDMYDDNGHGTHVCGVISGRRIGMAPESKLIVLKVLDEEGNGRIERNKSFILFFLIALKMPRIVEIIARIKTI